MRGKRHRIALYGQGNEDEKRITTDLKRIVEEEAAIWGGLPYEEYLFIVTHAVDFTRTEKFNTTELDLFLGKNFLPVLGSAKAIGAACADSVTSSGAARRWANSSRYRSQAARSNSILRASISISVDSPRSSTFMSSTIRARTLIISA